VLRTPVLLLFFGVIIIIALILLPVWGIPVFVAWRINCWRENQRKQRILRHLTGDFEDERPKQPSVIIEYFKAVKNKVCPIVWIKD
jgi:hypothetical protein